MFCRKCGKEVDPNSNYCGSCGNKITNESNYNRGKYKVNNNMIQLEHDSGSTFLRKGFSECTYENSNAMTFDGARSKIVLLVGILLVSMVCSLFLMATGGIRAIGPMMCIGFIVSTIVAFATCFNPSKAKLFSIIYAISEGMALAGLSYLMESEYPGVVFPAIIFTIAVVLAVTLIYNKIGNLSNRFISIISVATLGIAIGYGFMLLLSLFGVPMASTGNYSIVGIIISLIVIFVAAANLLLDYQFMKDASKAGADKEMEWYAAFSALVTIIWVYVEILDLLGGLSN